MTPIAAIIADAAFESGLARRELTGESHAKRIVRIRDAAIWAARRSTGHSSPRIGVAFGGRDHSTILKAIDRAERRRDTDPAFRRLSDKLVGQANERSPQ